MIIQHNIEAMNANRQLNIVGGTLAKSARNLSSGYKINIAADDAAGLSISEKMRKQVRGLNKGIENAEDGVSLCQVADGALTEVHDMLQRVNELAVKSANGTNSSSDRQSINDEVSALIREIDRIGDTTRFNELYVFRGTAEKASDQNTNLVAQPSAKGRFFQLLGDNTSNTGYMQEPLAKDKMDTINHTDAAGHASNPYVSVHIDFAELIDHNNNIQELAGTEFLVNCCTSCCESIVQFTDDTTISSTFASGTGTTKGEYKFGVKKVDGTYYSNASEFVNAIVDEMKNSNKMAHVQFACEGSTLYLYDIDNNAWSESSKQLAYFCDYPLKMVQAGKTPQRIERNSLWIQSGCEAGDGMTMELGVMNSYVLGMNDSDVLTEENATDMLSKVSKAIAYISRQRSRIGAYQNRLEHTIKNENNIVENTTAAESQIRDTDMATEMVKYSNLNVLTQAGQSMLAQANQSKQGILSLLSA